MDGSLTIGVLKEALALYPKPQIFNTDQGSQYTAHEHIKILVEHNIAISMDGKGRARDTIAIERFWRLLKYEDVYPRSYSTNLSAMQHPMKSIAKESIIEPIKRKICYKM